MKNGDRLDLAAGRPPLDADGVGLERFERRGGRLLNRHIVALERAVRLAERSPQRRGNAADGLEHVLLALDLDLIARDGAAVSAIAGDQRDDDRPPDGRDAAFDERAGLETDAGLLGDGMGQPAVRRARHHLHHVAQALVGDDVEERGLSEMDDQGLPQRAIEVGIVGGIADAADEQRTPSHRRDRAGPPPPPSADGDGQDHHGRGRAEQPPSPPRRRRDRPTAGRLHLASGAAQIREHVRGALVPVGRVLLQRVMDDRLDHGESGAATG